jgi:hypothetical protein
MIYKAVPGPKVIRIENDDISMATNAFADLINQNAVDGWKFHSLETIMTTETVKTGCFINQQTNTIEHNIYMLIFSKES